MPPKPGDSKRDKDAKESVLSQLATAYRFAMRTNPILVKSLTSGVLASFGNIAGQFIVPHSSTGKIVWRNVAAFGAFAALVTGPAAHYFRRFLELAIPRSLPYSIAGQVAIDQVLFSPPHLLAFFFCVAILEGYSVEEAKRRIQLMYWIALKMHWKFWTLAQLINVKFVPGQHRLLVGNIFSFLWHIYMATCR